VFARQPGRRHYGDCGRAPQLHNDASDQRRNPPLTRAAVRDIAKQLHALPSACDDTTRLTNVFTGRPARVEHVARYCFAFRNKAASPHWFTTAMKSESLAVPAAWTAHSGSSKLHSSGMCAASRVWFGSKYTANQELTTPNVWQALDRWAAHLKAWQRRILVFATRGGTLTNDQIDAVHQLFLAESNLCEPQAGCEASLELAGASALWQHR
jgi:hypothetical protein